MAKEAKVEPTGPAAAAVTLTTEMLERLIAEWVAKTAGIELPVRHTAHWGWAASGSGPVLVRMEVETVANVVPLRKKEG